LLLSVRENVNDLCLIFAMTGHRYVICNYIHIWNKHFIKLWYVLLRWLSAM